jgi:hypothetical protein
MPRNLIVVGAGVVGIEYAAMLGSLANTQVTVIDQRPELLEFVDREIVDNLVFHMREARGKFRLGEKVSIPPPPHSDARLVVHVCGRVCIVYCVYCVLCVLCGVCSRGSGSPVPLGVSCSGEKREGRRGAQARYC